MFKSKNRKHSSIQKNQKPHSVQRETLLNPPSNRVIGREFLRMDSISVGSVAVDSVLLECFFFFLLVLKSHHYLSPLQWDAWKRATDGMYWIGMHRESLSSTRWRPLAMLGIVTLSTVKSVHFSEASPQVPNICSAPNQSNR